MFRARENSKSRILDDHKSEYFLQTPCIKISSCVIMYKSVGFGEIKGHCRPAGVRSKYSTHATRMHTAQYYTVHTSALILLALQCHCAVSPRFESVILKGSWTLGECVLNSEVEVKVFPLSSPASLSRPAQLIYDTTVREVLHHLVYNLVSWPLTLSDEFWRPPVYDTAKASYYGSIRICDYQTGIFLPTRLLTNDILKRKILKI